MDSMVVLRWIIPAGWVYGSSREVVRHLIGPAARECGWLYGPGTTHHVSDLESEAWLTVVTPVDAAPGIEEDLTELLTFPPAVETVDDALLSPGAEWYRAALQEVTHASLDVLEAGAAIPLTEYAAFLEPSEAAPQLMAYLNEASPAYRRACPTYEATERFWLAFFRQGPGPELSRAGHWLWNLAG